MEATWQTPIRAPFALHAQPQSAAESEYTPTRFGWVPGQSIPCDVNSVPLSRILLGEVRMIGSERGHFAGSDINNPLNFQIAKYGTESVTAVKRRGSDFVLEPPPE